MANQVLQEVISDYNPEEIPKVPLNELLGTEGVPVGIIPLREIEKFIDNATGGVVSLSNIRSQINLKDPELKAIDGSLDD